MRWLKTLEENRDLVSIGAYVPGSDPVLDEALAQQDACGHFLTQGVETARSCRLAGRAAHAGGGTA